MGPTGPGGGGGGTGWAMLKEAMPREMPSVSILMLFFIFTSKKLWMGVEMAARDAVICYHSQEAGYSQDCMRPWGN